MTGSSIAALAGLLVSGGLVLGVWAGLIGFERNAFVPQRRRNRAIHLSRTTKRNIVIGLAIGLAIAIGTGFVIAIILGPVVMVLVPWLMAPAAGAGRIKKLEALSEWVRSMAGTHAAGRQVEESLLSSARNAPAEIEPQVKLLVARLRGKWTTNAALRAFAEDLDDPIGDKVVALLIQSVIHRGAGLSGMLQDLASSIDTEVSSLREIQSEMSEATGTARAVTIASVVFLAILLGASGSFLGVYSSGPGQVVALFLFALYVLLLIALRLVATVPEPPRMLGAKISGKARA